MAQHPGTADATILVQVNGEGVRIHEEATVQDLLQQLGAPDQGVAVELNREVIPRNAHASTQLHSGDRVEVVQFVGGG